jgi:cyclopropane-fatty-acyl-phospholipid synthase
MEVNNMTSVSNFKNQVTDENLSNKRIDLQNHLPNFLTRGMVRGINSLQMALSESYINGLEISDSQFKSVLKNFITILYRKLPWALAPYDWIVEESDRLAEDSEELMQVQYNLPTELFELMLKEGDLLYPKYSMALWDKGASNLEEAQMQMLDDCISKLGIEDGDEILDLGCGWGAAANYILEKFPNVKFTGLNLSREQCQYIRQKMQDPNSYLSSDRFTLYETDFNEAKFEKKFDKIITIGFFEHVGNLSSSFQQMASLLKDNGKIFLHIISIRLPHNIYSPFIDKYIFPRMRVWNYDFIAKLDRDLITIDKWYINGLNYSKTLQAWLKNFDEHQQKIKNLDFNMDYTKFRRLWRLYLIWCIAYFDACNGEVLGNGQYLMIKA